MIIGTYKITYYSNNISQMKNLIKHEDYLNEIKPTYDKIHELEIEISKLNKKKKGIEIKELENQIKCLKLQIKTNYGNEFFTTKSPLWLNHINGLLPLSFNSSKKELRNKTFPYSLKLIK